MMTFLSRQNLFIAPTNSISVLHMARYKFYIIMMMMMMRRKRFQPTSNALRSGSIVLQKAESMEKRISAAK